MAKQQLSVEALRFGVGCGLCAQVVKVRVVDARGFAGGGCIQATIEQIKALTDKAYAAGRERGSISCGNRT